MNCPTCPQSALLMTDRSDDRLDDDRRDRGGGRPRRTRESLLSEPFDF